MEMYQEELGKALEMIDASGRRRDDFDFAMTYLEPEPDGGGMFTVQYLIEIRNTKTDKVLQALGRIGNDWLGYFGETLAAGHFD